ncbi:L-proline trans-4-hydroxylase-like [Pecten maximus]|uniref:L-proline trans-4-hydroxylase-like n=1 Tax=Pecten maximus TaxID=6579 RepID=UPI00145907F4|nr:L-proline trans-4-hydroxylase-like [Pecten maximus]
MTSAEYSIVGGELKVTGNMRSDFDKYGYIMVRNFLDTKELLQIKTALEDHDSITSKGFSISDEKGRECKLALWNNPGNDVTGMVARCEKMVDTCEMLLGGEVYHYHTKLMMKNAETGGSHLWHQDYGYWYKNGCLYPDMLTVFISIDRCNKENGCLEILRSSHKCGRIEHLMVAGQTGADMDRVTDIKNSGQCPLEMVEMEPGDALFFHCNLLHTSGPNFSPHRRWAFLAAYNKATNDPVIVHHHSQYTPLHKVPNSAILDCTNFTDVTGKDFLDPKNDKTIVSIDDKAESPQAKKQRSSEGS